METILTEAQEKMMVGVLYNQVSFGTTLEVFGELSAEGIDRLNTQRETLEVLFKKYGLYNKLSPVDYLLLGMTTMIDRTQLTEWITNDNNKHLQLRAKYFIQK